MKKVGGVDGCPGGWLLVIGAVDGKGPTTARVVREFDEIARMVKERALAAVAVDIPIGLPSMGSRACDLQARRFIKSRRSSVFPAPIRRLLKHHRRDYSEVLRISRKACDRGISKQAYYLLEKIAEVDHFVRGNRAEETFEVHPECSFTEMAGHPMRHGKKTAAGKRERLSVLSPIFPDVSEKLEDRAAGVGKDDVLDAYAALWTAGRWLRGPYKILAGQERDRQGCPMRIVV
jgi:predicted RNase H-like nuclease